jgi:hypothetical protein
LLSDAPSHCHSIDWPQSNWCFYNILASVNGLSRPSYSSQFESEFYPDGIENKALPLSENMEFFNSLPTPVSLDGLEEDWWSPVSATLLRVLIYSRDYVVISLGSPNS